MSKTIKEIKKYILESVENIEPIDETEIQDKKKIKNFLVLHPKNFYDTSNYRGHITVSALILDNNLVLLTKNKYTNDWDVIKNHCEEGQLPFETIKKTIVQETGLEELKPKYIDDEGNPSPYYCNVYEVDVTPDDPADKNHIHLDLLYVFDIKNGQLTTDEKRVKWFSKNEASKLNKTVRKIIMKQMGKIII